MAVQSLRHYVLQILEITNLKHQYEDPARKLHGDVTSPRLEIKIILPLTVSFLVLCRFISKCRRSSSVKVSTLKGI